MKNRIRHLFHDWRPEPTEAIGQMISCLTLAFLKSQQETVERKPTHVVVSQWRHRRRF